MASWLSRLATQKGGKGVMIADEWTKQGKGDNFPDYAHTGSGHRQINVKQEWLRCV